MKIKIIMFALTILVAFTACTENYSNGDRVGLVTKLSETGVVWKTHEGHLNMTQTGMNSSTPFDFSIDRKNEPEGLIATLDSAALLGWKVKLTYHETMGWNWLNNRGGTDYFITECEILDKSPVHNAFSGDTSSVQSAIVGKAIDTIYFMLLPNDFDYQKYLRESKHN